jgi:hypothetical protein
MPPRLPGSIPWQALADALVSTVALSAALADGRSSGTHIERPATADGPTCASRSPRVAAYVRSWPDRRIADLEANERHDPGSGP